MDVGSQKRIIKSITTAIASLQPYQSLKILERGLERVIERGLPSIRAVVACRQSQRFLWCESARFGWCAAFANGAPVEAYCAILQPATLLARGGASPRGAAAATPVFAFRRVLTSRQLGLG